MISKSSASKTISSCVGGLGLPVATALCVAGAGVSDVLVSAGAAGVAGVAGAAGAFVSGCASGALLSFDCCGALCFSLNVIMISLALPLS